MKKHLLLCTFLIISLQASAQSELNVKLQPQNIFSPERAILPLSIEFKSGRFGVEYEHGFQVNSFFLNWNRNKQNERYFRSLVGLRFYLKNKAVKYSSSKLEHFLVLYGSYLPHHYQKTNGWYVRNDNTYNYETADVSFSLRKIYVCYGLQLPISDFLSLEYIVGLGQKTRTVNYETSGETFDPWNFQWDEWISVSDRSEGTRHFLFPAITFRVIFKLFSVEKDKKDEI